MDFLCFDSIFLNFHVETNLNDHLADQEECECGGDLQSGDLLLFLESFCSHLLWA